MGCFRIDAVARDRLGDRLRVDVALTGEGAQGRHGHVVAIHLEVAPQHLPLVAAAVSIGPQNGDRSGDQAANLLGLGGNIVRADDNRPVLPAQRHFPVAMAGG